jgi:hypothetical protein
MNTTSIFWTFNKKVFKYLPSFVRKLYICLLKKIVYFRTPDDYQKNIIGHKGEVRTFDKYRKDIRSQNGEDGVTLEILKRLKIDKGWFCEFGAWDGKHLSNSYFLISKGWKGVYIEGDKNKYSELVKNVKGFKNIIYHICVYVTAKGKNSLDNILANTSLPNDFEILSIDIDGDDYFVWKNLKKYKPKIVIIEVNSGYSPNIEITSTKNNKGTSFFSMVQLGKRKGYLPVYHTGNIFFVRKDYVNNLGLTENELRDPKTLFDYSWL